MCVWCVGRRSVAPHVGRADLAGRTYVAVCTLVRIASQAPGKLFTVLNKQPTDTSTPLYIYTALFSEFALAM